jgi:hypothetical protein
MGTSHARNETHQKIHLFFHSLIVRKNQTTSKGPATPRALRGLLMQAYPRKKPNPTEFIILGFLRSLTAKKVAMRRKKVVTLCSIKQLDRKRNMGEMSIRNAAIRPVFRLKINRPSSLVNRRQRLLNNANINAILPRYSPIKLSKIIPGR